MAKGYWISCYRSISNPEALAAYAKLAAPAIQAGGGRFLARGMPAKTYEQGVNQRTVIVEFESVARAIEVHDSPAYKEYSDKNMFEDKWLGSAEFTKYLIQGRDDMGAFLKHIGLLK